MPHEMIMIREHGPGFELPAEVAGQCEQTALEDVEPLGAAEMVRLLVSAAGYESTSPVRTIDEPVRVAMASLALPWRKNGGGRAAWQLF
jgi:hypothetical protein